MDLSFYRFDKLDSTSTYASENTEKIKVPAVIAAREQTAGRGRQGKTFYSPNGTGLYFTLIFSCDKVIANITPAAAVAVCKAIEKLTGKQPGIKWVNDVFIEHKKVCGILCESYIRNGKKYTSIGIGVNMTTAVFPPELSSAGSIDYPDKEKLMREILSYLTEYIENPDKFDIVTEYDKRMFLKGSEVTYTKNNSIFTGTVSGVDENCNLIVINSGGKAEKLSSGEIIKYNSLL